MPTAVHSRFGGIIVGDNRFAITDIRLNDGKFNIDFEADMVEITAGSPIKVYGSDGELILEGCWRGDSHKGPASFTYALGINGKKADSVLT